MLTVFLISAALIFLLSIDFGWSNVLTSQRNELVFEDRNHDYGAYALRREHHVNLFYAMIIGSGVIVGLIGLLSLQSTPRLPEIPAISIFAWDITPENLPEEQEEQQQAGPKRAVQVTQPDLGGEVQVTPDPVPIEPTPQPTPAAGPTDPNAPFQNTIQGPTGSGGNGVAPTTTVSAPSVPVDIPDYVAFMPEFPGGDAALIAYIQSNVEYDEMSIEQGVEGIIYISFVVTATGQVEQVKVARSIHNGQRLADEAVKVVRNLPRWKPGMQNNRPVAVRKTIPVRFQLK